jgi:hypothetical protein
MSIHKSAILFKVKEGENLPGGASEASALRGKYIEYFED